MDRGRHPGADGVLLPAPAGEAPGRRGPPGPPVLPATAAVLFPVLRDLAAAPGPGGVPCRSGGQPSPALLPGRAGIPCHLEPGWPLEPVHPHPGDLSRQPSPPGPAGRHLGSGSGLSRPSEGLFSRRPKLEGHAAGLCRRGDRPAGSRRGGPLPRPLATGPAAAFQPPELLSNGGRPGFLLSHVRHRSRRGGNAGVHSALRHAGPPAAGSANAAIQPARRLRAGPETSFLICGGPCSGHEAARGCGPSARPPAAPSRWGCAQNV